MEADVSLRPQEERLCTARVILTEQASLARDSSSSTELLILAFNKTTMVFWLKSISEVQFSYLYEMLAMSSSV